MERPLKILFIGDTISDCELILEHLKDNGYSPSHERVEEESELAAILDRSSFDVILCDHNLPNFDVLSAISAAKNKASEVPFIVVSGKVSESVAVHTLKAGAKDFILKNDLSRLIPAIEREMIDANSRAVHLRVEAELKKKEIELRQAQKLEAVGQLAGGVAHDFNNILAVILMEAANGIEFLNSRPDLRSQVNPVYENLKEITQSGTRAASLTRQLLAFSRKQVIQPKVLDANEIIREMTKMLKRVIEEHISLELDLDDSIKNIKVDPGHFEQIIVNLVVNSRDAMPHGGKLTLKTGNSEIDEETALKTNTIPGHYTLLQVTDTGTGMSEETQKRIFDPFFTTKGIGKGTGLGLSTVYGIVKQNNGLIFVKSKLGQGTTFSVHFPQTDESIQVASLLLPEAKDLSGTETLLVAEDEEALRKIVCQELRSKGYQVLEASDGTEAFELIKTYQNPIHMVLADAVMPKMGGRELLEKARSLRFQSKFLFLSGYTEEVLIQQGINSGQSYFLEKPFTAMELLHKVRSILSEGK